MEDTGDSQQGVMQALPAMTTTDILGISCRFPESGNAAEFWENLRCGRDMVTANDKRWPVGIYGLPPRSGKVPDFESFDASFFSVHGKQAQVGTLEIRLWEQRIFHELKLFSTYQQTFLAYQESVAKDISSDTDLSVIHYACKNEIHSYSYCASRIAMPLSRIASRVLNRDAFGPQGRIKILNS